MSCDEPRGEQYHSFHGGFLCRFFLTCLNRCGRQTRHAPDEGSHNKEEPGKNENNDCPKYAAKEGSAAHDDCAIPPVAIAVELKEDGQKEEEQPQQRIRNEAADRCKDYSVKHRREIIEGKKRSQRESERFREGIGKDEARYPEQHLKNSAVCAVYSKEKNGRNAKRGVGEGRKRRGEERQNSLHRKFSPLYCTV